MSSKHDTCDECAKANVGPCPHASTAASRFGSDRHDRPSVPPVSDKGSGTPSDPSSAAITPLRGPVKGWTVWICAHTHRWQSEDKSTRCPVCGTTTFKEDK
jgi:hypothetical protein